MKTIYHNKKMQVDIGWFFIIGIAYDDGYLQVALPFMLTLVEIREICGKD